LKEHTVGLYVAVVLVAVVHARFKGLRRQRERD